VRKTMRQIPLKCMRTLLETALADRPCDFSDENVTPPCPRCGGALIIQDSIGDVLQMRCRRCRHNTSMDCGTHERVN
jgi:hypothetical protein